MLRAVKLRRSIINPLIPVTTIALSLSPCVAGRTAGRRSVGPFSFVVGIIATLYCEPIAELV